MAGHLVSYDPRKHGEIRPPEPLGDESMALGSLDDLERILERMDPLDQDVIRGKLWGVHQWSLGEILGISQSGISSRTAQAIRCARHLAREPRGPWPEELQALMDSGPQHSKGPWFTLWARSTGSLDAFLPRPKPNSSAVWPTLRRRVGKRGSAGLREWFAWRCAMPRRFRPLGHPHPTRLLPEEARRRLFSIPRGTVRTAALLLGVSPEAVRMWRRRAGLPEDYFVRSPIAPPGGGSRGPTVAARILAGEVDGLRGPAAAEILGVSQATVRAVRSKLKIPSPGTGVRSPEERARILASVEGLTLKEAVAASGVPRPTLSTWRRKAGVRGPRHVVTKEMAEERLRDVSGLGVAEAALSLGISKRTFRKWRRRAEGRW